MCYKIHIVIGQPALQQNVDLKICKAADTGITVNGIESSIPTLQETYWASNKNSSSLMV